MNAVILYVKMKAAGRLADFPVEVGMFMLGTLNARIYNLDSRELEVVRWTDLENVRYFYVFQKHEKEFEMS